MTRPPAGTGPDTSHATTAGEILVLSLVSIIVKSMYINMCPIFMWHYNKEKGIGGALFHYIVSFRCYL